MALNTPRRSPTAIRSTARSTCLRAVARRPSWSVPTPSSCGLRRVGKLSSYQRMPSTWRGLRTSDPSSYAPTGPRRVRRWCCWSATGGPGRRRQGRTGSARQVDVDRGVVGGEMALDGVAVDLRADAAIGHRASDVQVVDAHAQALVEVAGAVIPPRELAGLGVVEPIGVDEAPVA